MKRDFMHFAFPQAKEKRQPHTAEEFADIVEQQILKMIEDGEEYGEIRLDIPSELTPEEAVKFIEEIMKRFHEGQDDD